MFPPLSAEFCITEALTHVDTNAFPNLSSMFDESSTGNIVGDSVRQEFCFACCLHGLIPEESIEGLLGEIPMQALPAGGRYTKEDLVQQCLVDPERAERLLEELDHTDGNVGAVSQALVEVRDAPVLPRRGLVVIDYSAVLRVKTDNVFENSMQSSCKAAFLPRRYTSV